MITPATRIRARSRAIVSVVAGRTRSTLLALGQIDGCRDRGRFVADGRHDDGVTRSEGQLRGSRPAIEGEGVHPLAVEHETDGPGRQLAEGRDESSAAPFVAADDGDHISVTLVGPGRQGGELVGSDVELAVAEAVDPQHLGVKTVGLRARQGDDTRDEEVGVER